MRKDKEGRFGLGKTSLGSDTESYSWFWFPILKPGFGRTLVLPL